MTEQAQTGIPAAAIEAAGHAMYGEDGWKSATDWWLARHRDELRQTLAAARPFLVADAQAAERERIATAIEAEAHQRWENHADGVDALEDAARIARQTGECNDEAIVMAQMHAARLARREPTDDR